MLFVTSEITPGCINMKFISLAPSSTRFCFCEEAPQGVRSLKTQQHCRTKGHVNSLCWSSTHTNLTRLWLVNLVWYSQCGWGDNTRKNVNFLQWGLHQSLLLPCPRGLQQLAGSITQYCSLNNWANEWKTSLGCFYVKAIYKAGGQ